MRSALPSEALSVGLPKWDRFRQVEIEIICAAGLLGIAPNGTGIGESATFYPMHAGRIHARERVRVPITSGTAGKNDRAMLSGAFEFPISGRSSENPSLLRSEPLATVNAVPDYSSPGRSKRPAFSNINTLAQRPSGDAMSRAATLSLGRMRTRNMIVAGCVPVIGGTTKSLQNPTVLGRSHAAAFVPQRPKLASQSLQFRDALFHMTDVGIQKRVDLATILFRRGAKSEQNPDFVQRHVQGTAMANE